MSDGSGIKGSYRGLGAGRKGAGKPSSNHLVSPCRGHCLDPATDLRCCKRAPIPSGPFCYRGHARRVGPQPSGCCGAIFEPFVRGSFNLTPGAWPFVKMMTPRHKKAPAHRCDWGIKEFGVARLRAQAPSHRLEPLSNLARPCSSKFTSGDHNGAMAHTVSRRDRAVTTAGAVG